MAKWLVTGGSGFLGINLIRYLLERGEEVVSLDLQPFTYDDCKDKIVHVQGDIRDKATVDSCMGGVDIFMHGAAALPLYPKKDIYTTNIGGTENVFQSALEHDVDRGIYISSTAVYGLPDHHPIYEDDPLVGVGAYGRTKIEAEKLVALFREGGSTITTIRPKSFVGPERLGVFGIFYEWASDGRSFPMIGRGNNLYQLLDVQDLCEAIYLAATVDGEKANTEFNIGATKFSTMREDYQVVLDRAGFGKKIKSSPANLVVMALETLEFFHLSPLYPWVYKTATKDSFVSVEKAEELLGFAPKYSNKDALLRNYEWYLTNLEKFESGATQDGVTHRLPWKQGVLGLAKRLF